MIRNLWAVGRTARYLALKTLHSQRKFHQFHIAVHTIPARSDVVAAMLFSVPRSSCLELVILVDIFFELLVIEKVKLFWWCIAIELVIIRASFFDMCRENLIGSDFYLRFQFPDIY